MHRTMIAASTILLALATNADAQDWPTRPMTLVVPFSAGGGVDVSARIQAQRMGELLGQTDHRGERRRGGRHGRWPARGQGGA